jgi:hypothetical protein
VFNLTAIAPTLLFTIAQRRLDRSWLRQLPTILLLSVFGAGLMVNTARAAWQAMRGSRSVFERTPKFDVRDRHHGWQRLRYQIGPDRIVAVEAAVMVLNAVTLVVALRDGVWAIAAYAAIFTAGLAGSVAVTLVQDRWKLGPLGGVGEAGQRIAPERLQERAQSGQGLRVDGVDPPIAVGPVGDQAGVLEHLEVLAHRGARHRQAAGDLDHRLGTVAQALQDQSPSAIAEGVEERLLRLRKP